ncbi:MAG: ATP-binding protein, partial [Armatimonadota bacterium]|nr:ATP-binding protein [Armatimonadota bacterium]
MGTGYRAQPPGLQKLRQQIAEYTNHRITFREIHELQVEGKRVLMFEIPPAIHGTPTTWHGVAYGRLHDRLQPLTLDQIDQIRRSAAYEDWSAEVCPDA